MGKVPSGTTSAHPNVSVSMLQLDSTGVQTGKLETFHYRRTIARFIMLTCPCNADTLTPHFYIVKLECTYGGYSFKPPHWGGSNVYPRSIF